MTDHTKSFTKVKKGKEETWTWEETPQVKEAIESYWTNVKNNEYWGKEGGEVDDEG